MNTDFRDIMRSLSITANYRGYRYTIVACKLILEDETKLYSITKTVYAETAVICECKTHSIERNIRTVIYLAWNQRRAMLNEIAGYTLPAPPTVSEFLAMITDYVRIQQKKT